MKEFKHTFYSMKRQKQRGITDMMIEEVLKYPDMLITTFDNRKVVTKEVNYRTITVVYIEKENYIRIITLF